MLSPDVTAARRRRRGSTRQGVSAMPSDWVVRKRRERLLRTGMVLIALALVGAYAEPKVAGAVHRAVQRRQFWSRLEIADKLVQENLNEALALTNAPSAPQTPAAPDRPVGSQLLPFRLLYNDLGVLATAFPPIQRAAVEAALDDFSAEWQQSVDPLIRGADERAARGAAAQATGKLVARLRQLK